MRLNERALRLVAAMVDRSDAFRVEVHRIAGGGTVIDCGVAARGGLLAGRELARICLADLADVAIMPGTVGTRSCPVVQVTTDHPVAACLAGQYAGWQLAFGKFFAMGSGPMRAARGGEAIFDKIGFREDAGAVVGVLEGRKLPGPEVLAAIAGACRVDVDQVTLLIAPTASLACGVQVVARSVETALHKLCELGFDLGRVISAHGSAPIPPVAKDDLEAIGRTNDAVLYGGRVVLHVTGDDASLAEIGPKVPSQSSKDYGEPFAAIFRRYQCDFYAVDPHLFSPAEIALQNIETGRSQTFGGTRHEVLERSFYS